MMTRTDYMNGTIDHHTFYMLVADAIGRDKISQLVLSCVAPADVLASRHTQDEHFNNIPLARWDGLHGAIRMMVQHRAKEVMPLTWPGSYGGPQLPPGSICWSLSETVCVAKAVARTIVESARVGA